MYLSILTIKLLNCLFFGLNRLCCPKAMLVNIPMLVTEVIPSGKTMALITVGDRSVIRSSRKRFVTWFIARLFLGSKFVVYIERCSKFIVLVLTDIHERWKCIHITWFLNWFRLYKGSFSNQSYWIEYSYDL